MHQDYLWRDAKSAGLTPQVKGGHALHANADMPVRARPIASACTSSVPSYVYTLSMFIMCRITCTVTHTITGPAWHAASQSTDNIDVRLLACRRLDMPAGQIVYPYINTISCHMLSHGFPRTHSKGTVYDSCQAEWHTARSGKHSWQAHCPRFVERSSRVECAGAAFTMRPYSDVTHDTGRERGGDRHHLVGVDDAVCAEHGARVGGHAPRRRHIVALVQAHLRPARGMAASAARRMVCRVVRPHAATRGQPDISAPATNPAVHARHTAAVGQVEQNAAGAPM